MRRAENTKNKMIRKQEDEKKERMTDMVTELKRDIEILKRELIEKEQEIEDKTDDADILKGLYDKGIIDIDGNLI